MDGLFAIPLAFRLTLTEIETAANHLSTEVIEDFSESFKNIYDNGQLHFTFEPNAQQLLADNIDQFVAEVNDFWRMQHEAYDRPRARLKIVSAF